MKNIRVLFIMILSMTVSYEALAQSINRYNIEHQITDTFRSELADKECREKEYKGCDFLIVTEKEVQKVRYTEEGILEVTETEKGEVMYSPMYDEQEKLVSTDIPIPFYFTSEYRMLVGILDYSQYSKMYQPGIWNRGGDLAPPVSLFTDDAAIRMIETDYDWGDEYYHYYRFTGGLGKLWYIGYDEEQMETGNFKELYERYKIETNDKDSALDTKGFWEYIVKNYDTRMSYKASSEYKEKNRIYSAKLLGIPIASGPWCEGVKGDGIGETIEMKLPKSAQGKENVLYLSNGYVSPYDGIKLYEYNGRVKQVRVYDKSAGYEERYALADTTHLQKIFLPQGVEKVTLEIEEVYKGSKWEDTCINFILLGD